ncbi:MAG: NADPH-dependent FMN reductase [Nitrososphaerales archaeon]
MPPKPLESVTVSVVGLAGSLRAEGFTRMAVRYALLGAEQEGAKTRMLDLASYDLPFLGQKYGNASGVESFRADLNAADGIVLGSPEYHGSISGVLKNALDFASSEEFEGKMVGLIGVAGGRMGATDTLNNLRTVGRALHAWVVPNQVSIGSSEEAFEPSGGPLQRDVAGRLKSVGWQVAHFARLHKCEDHLQFIKEWEGAPRNEAVDAALSVR